MTIWNVPGTGYGQQIVNAGDGPTMVINRDETHQLFVGSDSSVATKNGTGDIDIIDPLSYIVYDGIQSKFAIADTPGIFVTVDCVQGATNWAPSPAQAAQQISLLGLATETTQLSVKGNTANVATNTTGVAKDATVSTVATNTTGVAKDASLTPLAKDATLTTGIALPVGAAKEAGNLLTAAQLLLGNTPGALIGNTGLTVGQEVAALIASGTATGTPGGTPLLHGVNRVLNLPSTNIAAGASGSVPVTFTKPGYTISVSAIFTGAAGSVPFAVIEMTWTDGSGNTIAQENWSIPIINSGNPLNLTLGKGPVKSANLTFRFLNGSTAQCAFTASIFETTHHISRDDWRGAAPQFVNGFSAPTQFNPFGLMLGEVIQNGFAANGFISNLMPLYAGQVVVNISQSVSQAFSLTVNAQDPIMINAGGGNLSIYNQTFAAAKSFGPISINLPRCPCNFVFGNGPSLSNMTAFVNSLEYVS